MTNKIFLIITITIIFLATTFMVFPQNAAFTEYEINNICEWATVVLGKTIPIDAIAIEFEDVMEKVSIGMNLV